MVYNALCNDRLPIVPIWLCRPSKVIFADEISTGLDSSTTFQIVQGFANFAHMRKVTLSTSLPVSSLPTHPAYQLQMESTGAVSSLTL